MVHTKLDSFEVKNIGIDFVVVSRGSTTTHGHVNINEPRLYDLLPSRDRFEADCLRMSGKHYLFIPSNYSFK